MLAALDAGVFVSAAINPYGVASRIVAAAIDGRFDHLLCPRLVGDFTDVLSRPKITKRLSVPLRERFIADVVGVGRDVGDPIEVVAVSRDPKDDYVLALATEHAATGDDDLQALSGSPVPVLRLRAFLDLLDSHES